MALPPSYAGADAFTSCYRRNGVNMPHDFAKQRHMRRLGPNRAGVSHLRTAQPAKPPSYHQGIGTAQNIQTIPSASQRGQTRQLQLRGQGSIQPPFHSKTQTHAAQGGQKRAVETVSIDDSSSDETDTDRFRAAKRAQLASRNGEVLSSTRDWNQRDDWDISDAPTTSDEDVAENDQCDDRDEDQYTTRGKVITKSCLKSRSSKANEISQPKNVRFAVDVATLPVPTVSSGPGIDTSASSGCQAIPHVQRTQAQIDLDPRARKQSQQANGAAWKLNEQSSKTAPGASIALARNNESNAEKANGVSAARPPVIYAGSQSSAAPHNNVSGGMKGVRQTPIPFNIDSGSDDDEVVIVKIAPIMPRPSRQDLLERMIVKSEPVDDSGSLFEQQGSHPREQPLRPDLGLPCNSAFLGLLRQPYLDRRHGISLDTRLSMVMKASQEDIPRSLDNMQKMDQPLPAPLLPGPALETSSNQQPALVAPIMPCGDYSAFQEFSKGLNIVETDYTQKMLHQAARPVNDRGDMDPAVSERGQLTPAAQAFQPVCQSQNSETAGLNLARAASERNLQGRATKLGFTFDKPKQHSSQDHANLSQLSANVAVVKNLASQPVDTQFPVAKVDNVLHGIEAQKLIRPVQSYTYAPWVCVRCLRHSRACDKALPSCKGCIETGSLCDYSEESRAEPLRRRRESDKRTRLAARQRKLDLMAAMPDCPNQQMAKQEVQDNPADTLQGSPAFDPDARRTSPSYQPAVGTVRHEWSPNTSDTRGSRERVSCTFTEILVPCPPIRPVASNDSAPNTVTIGSNVRPTTGGKTLPKDWQIAFRRQLLYDDIATSEANPDSASDSEDDDDNNTSSATYFVYQVQRKEWCLGDNEEDTTSVTCADFTDLDKATTAAQAELFRPLPHSVVLINPGQRYGFETEWDADGLQTLTLSVAAGSVKVWITRSVRHRSNGRLTPDTTDLLPRAVFVVKQETTIVTGDGTFEEKKTVVRCEDVSHVYTTFDLANKIAGDRVVEVVLASSRQRNLDALSLLKATAQESMRDRLRMLEEQRELFFEVLETKKGQTVKVFVEKRKVSGPRN